MAVTEGELAIVQKLSDALDQSAFTDRQWNAYFEGTKRLDQIGLSVPPELRMFEAVVHWPTTSVESIDERLNIEGFRLAGEVDADAELWRVWQANNLDEESQLAHIDALVYGRSFVCVGSREDDASTPLVTVESPLEVTADVDPRTRRVSRALRRYDLVDKQAQQATLYLPDVTVYLRWADGRWVEDSRDEHRLGVVPVVPIINRRRTGSWNGYTEMQYAISMSDAASRALTNLQFAAETMAVPQRGVLGASKGDFIDSTTGEQLPAWEAYLGAFLALGNPDAKTFQFDAASLSNFHSTVNHYGSLVAGHYGLPMRYVGLNTANPPSADAIRAEEARLVLRAERKQRTFGGCWEDVMRLALRFKGEFTPEALSMETVWRDAATPTVSAKADAAQKLSGGQAILSREGVWDFLGWNEAMKQRERDRFAAQASDPLTEQLAASLVNGAAGAPAVGA